MEDFSKVYTIEGRIGTQEDGFWQVEFVRSDLDAAMTMFRYCIENSDKSTEYRLTSPDRGNY